MSDTGFLEQLYRAPRPIVLEGTRLPPGLRIAVAAPHPDDFDAIGITMRWLHAAGHHIELAVLTSGVSGVDDGFAGATTPEEKAAIREAEQRASCEFFGLPPSRLSFLRGAGAPAVAAFLDRADPQLVFLPHGNDSNATHQQTHALVTDALTARGKSVMACFSEDPKTITIRRDLVMPFGEADAEWKAALLRHHASQQARNLASRGSGLDARILDMNRASARAVNSTAPFVEAFELGG